MTDLLRLDRSNPNAFIGFILLIVLVVFVLPDRLPAFFAEISPQGLASMPCARLPAARDLAGHQSILGRAIKDPLRIAISADPISAEGTLTLQLSAHNLSLGTTPVVFQADNIVVAGEEEASNGFGLIVSPPPASGLNERRQPAPTGYEELDIRLLGPRQSCVHHVELTASAAMIAAGGTVQAWYRMDIAGDHQPLSEGTREIYSDQGLRILSQDIVRTQVVQVSART